MAHYNWWLTECQGAGHHPLICHTHWSRPSVDQPQWTAWQISRSCGLGWRSTRGKFGTMDWKSCLTSVGSRKSNNLRLTVLSRPTAMVVMLAVDRLKTVRLSRTQLMTNQSVKVLDTISSSAETDKCLNGTSTPMWPLSPENGTSTKECHWVLNLQPSPKVTTIKYVLYGKIPKAISFIGDTWGGV